MAKFLGGTSFSAKLGHTVPEPDRISVCGSRNSDFGTQNLQPATCPPASRPLHTNVVSIFNTLLKILLHRVNYGAICVTMTTAYYQKRLKEELAHRCERNPRYSVRSFARALQIDAGALSRILGGKQIPSFKLAQKLIDALDLEQDERRNFLASLAETQRSRGLERLSPVFMALESTLPQREFSIDVYRVIADWYHVAILELTYVEGFQSNARWIAKQLGISAAEAQLAIDRLLELELLEKKKNKLVKTQTQLTTADKHLTTPALRKHQKQLLLKAIDSLENDPVEARNITSMTMAIDPTKLVAAKEMIREFNKKLCAFLEEGKQKRVYNLGVALYPLQKEKEN